MNDLSEHHIRVTRHSFGGLIKSKGAPRARGWFFEQEILLDRYFDDFWPAR
jgi:hypothetical protein